MAVGQYKYHHRRHSLLQQPLEQDVELGEVEGFGLIKHQSHRLASLPQVVLKDFLDQPGCLARAAPGFKAKLE